MRLTNLVAVTVAALLLAAACSNRPAPSTAPQSQSQRENPNSEPGDLTAMIACFRAHGLPNFPDPGYDPSDGRWHFANNSPALTSAIRQACASVMPQATPASPIPTSQLDDLLNFAKCVRAHGMPEWPDPGVDGVFHTSIDLKTDSRAKVAMLPCQHYLASSGGALSLGQPNG